MTTDSSLPTPEVQLPRVGVECPTGDDVDWKKAWFTLAAERNRDVSVLLSKLSEKKPRPEEDGAHLLVELRGPFNGCCYKDRCIAWIERLERENLELQHDMERGMANHNADLNAAPQVSSGEGSGTPTFAPSPAVAASSFLDKQQRMRAANSVRSYCQTGSGMVPVRLGSSDGDWVKMKDYRQLERELADVIQQRDYYAAKVNGTPEPLPSATTALKQLVEAVDGMADMDEADGPEFFAAERRLESAMENAKRCLCVDRQ